MSANFKSGNVPSRILVCWSLNEPERRLIRRIIVVNVQGDLDYHDIYVTYRTKGSCHAHFKNLCLSCQSTSASNRIHERELLLTVAAHGVRLLLL